MPVGIFKAYRQPGADRVELGQAALDWCRAVRNADGARARFYWIGPNAVGFIVEAETSDGLTAALGESSKPVPEIMQAAFRLADLADPRPAERWIDPHSGDEAYRMAGRA